ncbi:hypothetical protein AX14_003677 [Amanita brunnescens Koide BX004]|nr:hypothetical protein AX14_003677 [Amanita brunnescens Koide BX004]
MILIVNTATVAGSPQEGLSAQRLMFPGSLQFRAMARRTMAFTKLNLEATMSRVTIPKRDARTHLSTKTKNASEYTLLSGTGSVYVDGSFIHKSTIPTVSPGESFDCALGLDPAIRITYHPLSKKSPRTPSIYQSITSSRRPSPIFELWIRYQFRRMKRLSLSCSTLSAHRALIAPTIQAIRRQLNVIYCLQTTLRTLFESSNPNSTQCLRRVVPKNFCAYFVDLD